MYRLHTTHVPGHINYIKKHLSCAQQMTNALKTIVNVTNIHWTTPHTHTRTRHRLEVRRWACTGAVLACQLKPYIGYSGMHLNCPDAAAFTNTSIKLSVSNRLHKRHNQSSAEKCLITNQINIAGFSTNYLTLPPVSPANDKTLTKSLKNDWLQQCCILAPMAGCS